MSRPENRMAVSWDDDARRLCWALLAEADDQITGIPVATFMTSWLR